MYRPANISERMLEVTKDGDTEIMVDILEQVHETIIPVKLLLHGCVSWKVIYQYMII